MPSVPSDSSCVLVVGASGMLGSAVARRLLAAGYRVRGFARNRERLQTLADAGAEVFAADLRDAEALAMACQGVQQLISTANNVQGSGQLSPNRVDLAAYRTLAAAARAAAIERWTHVSVRGSAADSIVEFFRLKHQVDQVVRASGVPFVLLQPPAFMDIWIDVILADGMRKSGTATIFGSGERISNYIAVDDVADYAMAIVARPDIRNEAVECGGPSDASMNALVSQLEKAMGITVKRRHIPAAVLRYGSHLLRPFHEVAARMMSLGYFSTVGAAPFPNWQLQAARFDVTPMTVETYIAKRYGKGAAA